MDVDGVYCSFAARAGSRSVSVERRIPQVFKVRCRNWQKFPGTVPFGYIASLAVEHVALMDVHLAAAGIARDSWHRPADLWKNWTTIARSGNFWAKSLASCCCAGPATVNLVFACRPQLAERFCAPAKEKEMSRQGCGAVPVASGDAEPIATGDAVLAPAGIAVPVVQTGIAVPVQREAGFRRAVSSGR